MVTGRYGFRLGKCAISGPLNASTSGLTVAGAGMHATTIVAMPNFDYDPARTPRGLDGQYVGMLWTDLPVPPPARGISAPQPPLQHVTIRDLGLDPRAGTQRRFYKFNAISGFARAIQYFTVRNVYFELGSPLSWTDLTKPFKGVDYIVLSYDPANASHDLLFENIEAHNGVGSIQLRQGAGYTVAPCPAVVHDRIYGIKILNEKDIIDLNDIQDDRIVITAKACHPGAEMDDIQVSGQVVTVAPSVTNGGANGLKIEAANSVMRNVQYTDIQYTGSPNGSYLASGTRVGSGNPFGALIFDKDSGMSNIVVAHVHAVNSEGIGVVLRGGPSGEPMSITFDDLTLTNSYGAACVRFASISPPTGKRSSACSQRDLLGGSGSARPVWKQPNRRALPSDRRRSHERRFGRRLDTKQPVHRLSAAVFHLRRRRIQRRRWSTASAGTRGVRPTTPRRSCGTRRKPRSLTRWPGSRADKPICARRS